MGAGYEKTPGEMDLPGWTITNETEVIRITKNTWGNGYAWMDNYK